MDIWDGLISLAGNYVNGAAQGAATPPPAAAPPSFVEQPRQSRRPDLGAPGGMINQSVPQAPQSGADAQKKAMLDMLLGNDQEEALRQQAMVEQLRGYGGGNTPQMRRGYAAKPIEYAATMGNRLASMQGQSEAREAERRALEEFRRRLPTGGGGAPGPAAGMPADPSFGGVGNVPY